MYRTASWFSVGRRTVTETSRAAAAGWAHSREWLAQVLAAFQAVFSRLSHAELERLALVCGELAQAIFWAATDPSQAGPSAAAVPRRHGGGAGGVVFSVTSSPSASQAPAHRSSLSLRIVLEALDRSGAGSLEFWRVYWMAVPHLTEADLVRVARAVGPVGRAHLRTLSGREARTAG